MGQIGVMFDRVGMEDLSDTISTQNRRKHLRKLFDKNSPKLITLAKKNLIRSSGSSEIESNDEIATLILIAATVYAESDSSLTTAQKKQTSSLGNFFSKKRGVRYFSELGDTYKESMDLKNGCPLLSFTSTKIQQSPHQLDTTRWIPVIRNLAKWMNCSSTTGGTGGGIPVFTTAQLKDSLSVGLNTFENIINFSDTSKTNPLKRFIKKYLESQNTSVLTDPCEKAHKTFLEDWAAWQEVKKEDTCKVEYLKILHDLHLLQKDLATCGSSNLQDTYSLILYEMIDHIWSKCEYVQFRKLNEEVMAKYNPQSFYKKIFVQKSQVTDFYDRLEKDLEALKKSFGNCGDYQYIPKLSKLRIVMDFSEWCDSGKTSSHGNRLRRGEFTDRNNILRQKIDESVEYFLRLKRKKLGLVSNNNVYVSVIGLADHHPFGNTTRNTPFDVSSTEYFQLDEQRLIDIDDLSKLSHSTIDGYFVDRLHAPRGTNISSNRMLAYARASHNMHRYRHQFNNIKFYAIDYETNPNTSGKGELRGLYVIFEIEGYTKSRNWYEDANIVDKLFVEHFRTQWLKKWKKNNSSESLTEMKDRLKKLADNLNFDDLFDEINQLDDKLNYTKSDLTQLRLELRRGVYKYDILYVARVKDFINSIQ